MLLQENIKTAEKCDKNVNFCLTKYEHGDILKMYFCRVRKKLEVVGMKVDREAKKLAKQARKAKKAFKKTSRFLFGSLFTLVIAYVICFLCFDIEFETLTGILWGTMLTLIAVPIVVSVVARLIRNLWKLKWPIIVSAIFLIAVPVGLSVALDGNVFDLGAILKPVIEKVLALLPL